MINSGTEPKKAGSVRLYARVVRYAAPYIPWLACVVALAGLIVVFDGLSLWFSATVVKTLFLPAGAAAEPKHVTSLLQLNDTLKYWTFRLIQRPDPMESLKLVCLLMAGSFFFKNLFTYLKDLVIRMINLFMIRDIYDDLFAHIIALPVHYFDGHRTGAVMSLLANDVARINDAMVKTFSKIFSEPARVALFTAMLLVINARLALIVVLTLPPCMLLIRHIGQLVRRKSLRVNERMAGLLSVLHETVTGIRVVKMFNMSRDETAKFGDQNRRFVRDSYVSQIYSALSSPLVETLGSLLAVLLILYGGTHILRSESFTAEDFVRFLVLLFAMYQPLKSLGEVYNKLQEGLAGADRVFATLDIEPEHFTPGPAGAPAPEFRETIAFDHVGFRYPGYTAQVLDDICFDVQRGQVVAIVGPSGSGKSTLLDLLPRFYEATSGAVRIDGADIRTLPLADLRGLFGIVSQDTVLFNDTVARNIAYGAPQSSREQIIEAATLANAWEFIQAMPRGLDTEIGEKGVTLSGGQRQRIAIARAILKNPPILILDEATSALDTESERMVQNAILRLIKNRTVLVVAHRFSTIMSADLILVLENGRIVERGTHEQLLNLQQRYRYLHDMQFSAPGGT